MNKNKMIPLDEGRLLIRKKYQNFLEKNEEKEQSKKNLQLAHQPYHEYMKRMEEREGKQRKNLEEIEKAKKLLNQIRDDRSRSKNPELKDRSEGPTLSQSFSLSQITTPNKNSIPQNQNNKPKKVSQKAKTSNTHDLPSPMAKSKGKMENGEKEGNVKNATLALLNKMKITSPLNSERKKASEDSGSLKREAEMNYPTSTSHTSTTQSEKTKLSAKDRKIESAKASTKFLHSNNTSNSNLSKNTNRFPTHSQNEVNSKVQIYEPTQNIKNLRTNPLLIQSPQAKYSSRTPNRPSSVKPSHRFNQVLSDQTKKLYQAHLLNKRNNSTRTNSGLRNHTNLESAPASFQNNLKDAKTNLPLKQNVKEKIPISRNLSKQHKTEGAKTPSIISLPKSDEEEGENKWKGFSYMIAKSYDEMKGQLNSVLAENKEYESSIEELNDQVSNLKSLLKSCSLKNEQVSSELKKQKLLSPKHKGNPISEENERLKRKLEYSKREKEILKNESDLKAKIVEQMKDSLDKTKIELLETKEELRIKSELFERKREKCLTENNTSEKEALEYYKRLSEKHFDECSSLAEQLICLRSDYDKTQLNFVQIQKRKEQPTLSANTTPSSQKKSPFFPSNYLLQKNKRFSSGWDPIPISSKFGSALPNSNLKILASDDILLEQPPQPLTAKPRPIQNKNDFRSFAAPHSTTNSDNNNIKFNFNTKNKKPSNKIIRQQSPYVMSCNSNNKTPNEI